MNGTGQSVSGQVSPALHDAGADDRALVARIAAREEAAFREAITAHAPTMNRIAYRMTGQPHEAEDIVQEAMLRLWDHASRLEAQPGAIRIAPWLKRVTINLAIDRLRLARRVSSSEVPERADDSPLADERIAQTDEAVLARHLIAQLPDRQRAAIVLTYYEEQANADAARALDMNIKAFESLLHRARAALRKAFDQAQAQGGAR
ncbi:MAG: sigma-70 family RNA polymerase sigma factor [Erythrobacter sp.]|jgi:RNA polymerase sigma-70 factor (ECF subfamily)|nr:sigma-70 family RNA polymerase sigma factor [Erythrobacter sp.]